MIKGQQEHNPGDHDGCEWLPAHVHRIQRAIYESTGMDVHQYKDDFFVRQIGRRKKKLKISTAQYVLLIENNPQEINGLVEHLTVYHTCFFRDLEKYNILQDVILPELVERKKKKKKLRIWSAGCASGEEPLSIAIVLQEYFGERLREWDIDIVATDMNDMLIGKARKGVFSGQQLTKGAVSSKIFKNYFFQLKNDAPDVHDDLFVVSDRVRSMVNFKKHNLLKDAYPVDIDIIFCRNVLIYIKYEYAKKILLKFHQNINEDGYLLLGNFESLDMSFLTTFERIKKNKEFVYRKIVQGSAVHVSMIQREKNVQAGLGIKKSGESYG